MLACGLMLSGVFRFLRNRFRKVRVREAAILEQINVGAFKSRELMWVAYSLIIFMLQKFVKCLLIYNLSIKNRY